MKKFTLELLNLIENLANGLDEFVSTPYGQLRMKSIPRSTFYNALGRLENLKLVTKKKIGQHSSYRLTPKGRAILAGPIKKKPRNDGYSTIVIFDIPEEKYRQRSTLRRFLKQEGYTSLQKSVYISPFQISQELKDLIRELHIRVNVSIIDGRVNYTL